MNSEEILFGVAFVLTVINLFQGWIIYRMSQGLEVSLPAASTVLFDALLKNQGELLEAATKRAAQTPSQLDDKAVAIFNFIMSRFKPSDLIALANAPVPDEAPPPAPKEESILFRDA